jgi:hypothetical protein
MKAGQWNISTGQAVFTSADLAAAVAALDCPAVRRPVLKLGHVDPRFDGEPAVGWIDNMAVADAGVTLVGDYVGMPGWLGDVIASAYPDRSIEGMYDFGCQVGHTHPFVVTAVALLGVTSPGIGNLASLIDVAALYGVAASESTSGVPVSVTVHASKESDMPNPRPLEVAAGVSTEDIRRRYYDDAPWSYWITEFELSPLQLIVCDDNTGKHFRVPVTVSGEDSFTFGDAVEVLVRYVDKPAEPVAASARLVFASRAESRPGPRPAAASDPTPQFLPPTEPPSPAGEPEPPEQPVETPAPEDGAPESPAAEPDPSHQEDDMSLSTEVRQRLGLGEDADEQAVLAALDARLHPDEPDPQPEPDPDPAVDREPATVGASALPPGVVTIDQDTLDALRRNAELGAAAHERQRTADRDREIEAAMGEGKFAPARRDHWVRLWEADPEGTKATLAALEPGLVVPVTVAGHTGPAEPGGDDEWKRLEAELWPADTTSKGA